MTDVLKAAINHRGFSYVDVLQACPTYNKFATHEYLLEHVFDVQEENHDISDFEKSRAIAVDTSERISTGVLYQNKESVPFLDRLEARKGVETRLVDEVEAVDVEALVKRFI